MRLGRLMVCLGAMTLATSLARPAAADDDAAPATSTETHRARSEWYGWQILVSDGASLSLAVLGVKTGAAPLNVLSGLGYVLAPPVIHGLHGEGGGTAISLGLRLGVPLAFGITGAVIGREADRNCGQNGFCGLNEVVDAALGIALGMLTASVVDVAAVAWTHPKPPSETSTRSFSLTPTAYVTPNPGRPATTSVGLVGAF